MRRVWLRMCLVGTLLGFAVLWFAPLLAATALAWLFLAHQGLGSLMTALGMGLCLVFLIPFVYVTHRVLHLWRSCPAQRRPPDQSSLALHEGEAPGLFELIERTRKRAELRKPVELRITMLPFISGAFRCTVSGSRRGSYPLTIGLPAMAVLTPEQLEMMLCHEMALLNLWPRAVARLVLLKTIASRFVPPPRQNPYSLGQPTNYFAPFLRCCEAFLQARNSYARTVADPRAGQYDRISKLYMEGVREFYIFWRGPVEMIRQTGYTAPLLEGFERFWRTRAPETFRLDGAQGPEQSALSLLRSPAAVEARFTSAILRGDPGIEAVSGERIGTVLLSNWAAKISPYAPLLARLARRVRSARSCTGMG